MKILLLALCFALSFGHLAMAQTTPVQDVLQSQRALIEKSSRRTIGPAIDALVASGLPLSWWPCCARYTSMALNFIPSSWSSIRFGDLDDPTES